MGYSDLGDKYRNPILFADYSDPDVIRVGDTFYMTASSFNYTPGLPILISKDLVNWKLVNYALKNIGQERYKIPRHSAGVWAPSIRFHEGLFYIYYGMPDEGIYVVRTKDPLGEWEEPVCVLEGKGLIDSCPFWDEDGRAYIVHGFAKSRIGFKSILGMFEISWDGLSAISEDHFIFDGNDPEHPAVTIEGPKVYKRNGFYYIWAPAGGVREGYQVVLRSKEIQGPYEIRTVMSQGTTVINGPHQGGLVDTVNGDAWFIHFQDRGLYGRICHLQPVSWQDDWPVVGNAGEPVEEWPKPNCEILAKSEPESCGLEAYDSFAGGRIGHQWQWMGDHSQNFAGSISTKDKGSKSENAEDGLRLFCLNPSGDVNPTIWRSANVLTQKLIYPIFEAEVQMDASCLKPGDRAGVCMTGGQYVAAFIERDDAGEFFVKTLQSTGDDDDKAEALQFCEPISKYMVETSTSMEEVLRHLKWKMEFTGENSSTKRENLYFANVNGQSRVTLKISLSICVGDKADIGDCSGHNKIDLGVNYTPSDHTWVGAKLGLFALTKSSDDSGHADFKDFVVKEL